MSGAKERYEERRRAKLGDEEYTRRKSDKDRMFKREPSEEDLQFKRVMDAIERIANALEYLVERDIERGQQ
jgi:hypothetical protein